MSLTAKEKEEIVGAITDNVGIIINGHTNTFSAKKNFIRGITSVIATLGVALIIALAAAYVKLESVPTTEEVRKTIATEAPWVKDKPYIVEDIKETKEAVEEVQQSIVTLGNRQREDTQEILEAVKRNGD